MRSKWKVILGLWIVFSAVEVGFVYAQPAPPPPPRERPEGRGFRDRERMGSQSRPEDDDDRPRFRRGRSSRFDDRPRFDPGGEQEPLTPEQIDRIMEFAKEHFPQIHERLVKARDSDQGMFRMMIRRTARVVMPILRVAVDDPELAKKMIAEQKTQMALEQLGRQYRNSTDPQEREQLKTRIREQMTVRFDMRLERLRNEIRNLQRRLDEAKEDLADQEKNKQTLIDKKLEAYLAAPDDEREHHHKHRFEDHPATRPD